MKQKLLFALLALITGWGSASAQTWTDKTSVITNPSFEKDDAIADLKSCGWATDRATGWTIAPNSPSNSQVGIGNSSSVIQGIAASFAPSAGYKYFYMRENWNPNTTFSVSQMIQSSDIPAGFYRLTVKAAMFSSVASTYTLSLQETGQTAATNSFSYAGTANSENWRDWSVVLYKQADDTDLTITAAYKTPGENSGGKHYCLLLDDVKLEYLAPADASSTNPYDVTWLIKNPGFDNNSGDGWTMTTTFTNWGANAIANGNKQQWNGNFNVSQELPTLPNGVYELGVQGFYRPGGNDSQSTDQNAVLFAIGSQEVTSPLMLVSAGGSATQDNTNGYTTAYTGVDPNVYVPNSQGDAEKAFAAGGYSGNSLQVIVTNGQLTIGAKKETLISNDWTVFDNFSLKYLGTDLLLTAVIDAWNTTHANLAALDATLLPDAAEQAITEELAKARPNTEAEIVAATAALQALIDSYPGIKAAYDEYKALKAKVEDLKNTSKYTFTGDAALSTFNSTLSTIDGNAEAATDAATLTTLLPSLKTAGNTFVGAIESNDGFDLTYNIENNSFETGALSPWTTNGGNDTGVRENSNGTYTTTGVDGAYLFNTWNNGAGSKVSQTLSSLPKGYYIVTALVASDAGNSINILAGASTKAVEADATDGKGVFVEGTTDKVLVSDGSLEIGTNSSTWYKTDNFRLTFYTEAAGARDAWLAAKAAAEAARDDAAYTNVTGSERTDLLAEIAKTEPTTAEAYGTATTALQEKTSAFIAAKDSYDGLVAMRTTGGDYTTDWPRAAAAKKTALDDAIAAVPTNAADAVTKTNAIVTAYRQFVESNGLAEGVATAVDKTSLLLVSDANVSTSGWTSGSIGTNQGQAYTMGDGNQPAIYFDGGWASNAGVDITLTQELTLPAGEYQLQITARGATDLTSYTMSVGTTSVDLPHIGGADGTFGNGWSDKFVVFTSDGTTPLTLTIAAASTASQQWISFNRLRLIKLDASFADANDYSNLNTAIAAAEAKTLGFENGQYAPYNNVAVLTKLAEAKAIDSNADNEQEVVQGLTSYLNDAANWTANTSDVDAIFNGAFAETGTGNNPKGWTRSNNGWGQQITGLTAEANGVNTGTTTAWYYNTNGSWQYGNDGVYTMPLAANQTYVLSFKYRKHNNDWQSWMKASVVNDNNEGLEVAQFPGADDGTTFQSAKAYFTTGAAGNYILSIEQNGNAHLTDVSLVKTTALTTTSIDEASTTNVSELAYYESISLTRTLAGGSEKWNTFSVPFDMAIPTGWTVKEFDSADDNTLNFKNAESIVAGTPYLVQPSDDVVNPTYNNVVLKKTEGEIKGTGDYKFAAQIYKKDLPTDGTIAYMTTSADIKKLTSGGIKGLRAYFIIPDGASTARIHFLEEGETTEIDLIDNVTIENGNAYDLQGRRVVTMKRGIYVVNGKKIVIK